MVITDLYTMACRQHMRVGTASNLTLKGDMQDMQLAFDDALSGESKPDFIIVRVHNWSRYYFRYGQFPSPKFRDPFYWKLAWVNPDGILFGPRLKGDSGIAVIEDRYGGPLFGTTGRLRWEPRYALHRQTPSYWGRRKPAATPLKVYEYFRDNFTICDDNPIIESAWWNDWWMQCLNRWSIAYTGRATLGPAEPAGINSLSSTPGISRTISKGMGPSNITTTTIYLTR